MEDLVQRELLYISRALLQHLWKCTSDNMKLFFADFLTRRPNLRSKISNKINDLRIKNTNPDLL
jgi:hypothetical protein